MSTRRRIVLRKAFQEHVFDPKFLLEGVCLTQGINLVRPFIRRTSVMRAACIYCDPAVSIQLHFDVAQ